MLLGECFFENDSLVMHITSTALNSNHADGTIVRGKNIDLRFRFDLDPFELYGRAMTALSKTSELPRGCFPGHAIVKNSEEMSAEDIALKQSNWVLNCRQNPTSAVRKNGNARIVSSMVDELIKIPVNGEKKMVQLDDSLMNHLKGLRKKLNAEVPEETPPSMEFEIERAMVSKKNAERYRFTVTQVGLHNILSACKKSIDTIGDMRIFDGVKIARDDNQIVLDTGNIGRFTLSEEQREKMLVSLHRFIESGVNKVPSADVNGLKVFVIWKNTNGQKMADGLTIQIQGRRATIGQFAAAQLFSYLS